MHKVALLVALALGSFIAARADTRNSEQQVITSSSSSSNSSRLLKLAPSQQQDPQHDEFSAAHEQPETTEATYAHGLPHLKLQRDIYTSQQMDIVYEFFKDIGRFHKRNSVTEFGLIALTAKSHAMVYNDMLTHRYDSFSELKQSTGPHIDNELCLRQLGELNERAHRMNSEKFNSTDLNLYHLLDTYGRVPPGMVAGSALWTGMYDDCLRLRLDLAEGAAETRYCLAIIKHDAWPTDSEFSKLIALKAGVCLPKSCDSMRYKNKYELVQRLMEFNAREVDKGQAYLDNLYCMPDADSPVRMWWRSPKHLQAFLVMGGWVALLVYATVKYERAERSKRARGTSDKGGAESFGLTNGFSLKSSGETAKEANGDRAARQQVRADPYSKVYQMLAITRNFKLLFDTSKTSALLETGDKLKSGEPAGEGPEKQQTGSETSGPDSPAIVDLRCLEGIKVICMSYVIMGHVLMCITGVISNGREIGQSLSPAFFIANMMPAFAVNSFFTITGLLTCYLLFKQNQSHAFLTSPVKWAAFILYRYLRIMPMYVVVVYYSKYISKFTGSGPLWDYGTSSLAHRRRCEEEPWLWTLLFGANLKPVMEHCIPSAWYLANDFQFFVVTPIFLALLHRRPQLGQWLLKGCVVAGYLAGMYSIAATDASDMRPIAQFMPHGFKTYVTFLSPSYTRPQYRIPAYLCGLLFGYQLHVYEQHKLRHRQQQQQQRERQVDRKEEQPDHEPGWSEWFVEYGMKLSLFFVVLCALVPVIGAQIPSNKLQASLLVAVFMSSYHILFALAVGFYILLATTGHGSHYLNECLSASFWKPLARLSLCTVLINIEVVSYIIQTHRQQIYVDFFTQCALNLLGIVATYLAAVVMCVLFEAPIRAALNQLLSHVITRMAAPRRKVE